MVMDHPESWDEARAEPASNALGIVGFVLAFCISPLGLVLSLAALARPPRGFAIAGVLVGAIGSALWAVVIFAGVAMGPMFMKTARIGQDYEQVSRAVNSYKAAHSGSLPTDLDGAGLAPSRQVDPWGTAYAFTVAEDGSTWTLTSGGPDGALGTDDDIVLPAGLDPWAVGDAISKSMRAHYRKRPGSGGAPASSQPGEGQPHEAPADPPARQE